MTVDIISEFSFGTCINMINEDPDTFNSEYLKAMEVASALPFLRYYSTMQWLLGKCVPISVAANFSPILRQTEKMVGIIVDSYHHYAQRTTNSRFPVLFDNLQTLPADSQKAEAINTFIAGSDTTAFTLVTALYHILRLPEVEKTLTASLDELFGGSQSVPSLVQLEQTKYLVSAIGIL